MGIGDWGLGIPNPQSPIPIIAYDNLNLLNKTILLI